LETEPAQLPSAHVLDHLRRDAHALQRHAAGHDLIRAVEQRLELDARALLRGQALDQQALAALDAILLGSTSDDRVHGGDGLVPAHRRAGWRGCLLRARLGLGSRTAPSAPAAAAPWFRLSEIG